MAFSRFYNILTQLWIIWDVFCENIITADCIERIIDCDKI